jgi:hypothetical protein
MNIFEFAVKIIILQLCPIEDNKRKKTTFDYILIAEANERGKKLRRLRYKIFSYNGCVQRMAILFRKNSVYN